jgi:hypothetical protein
VFHTIFLAHMSCDTGKYSTMIWYFDLLGFLEEASAPVSEADRPVGMVEVPVKQAAAVLAEELEVLT